MSDEKISQGMRELIAARSECKKCEARIEINQKLHEHNVSLGARIAELEAYIVRNCDPFDMTVEDADFFATINPYALEKGDD